jgi:hypothetical protein
MSEPKIEEKSEPKTGPQPPTLEEIIQSLSEQTEKPLEEVQKGITELINKGYSEPGAVATWKSNNKQLLGTKQDFNVRVIGKDGVRTAKIDAEHSQRVTNLAFYHLTPEGTIALKNVTLWAERVELADKFKLGGTYHVRGKERGGQITYMKPPEDIPDDLVPDIWRLPEFGVIYAKPGQVLDYAERTELFHGWIGKLIRDTKGSGKVIGFELSDAESYPVTVWCGEKYGALPIELKEAVQSLRDGDEVLVYGYVSLSGAQGEPRINCKGLFIKPSN